jgi:ribonuclease D
MSAAHAGERALAPEELARAARAAGRFGVEAKLVSASSYRALLCLVQIAVADERDPSRVRIELLDPLAGFDHAPLAAALADPAVEVVLHAGAQDVAILRRAWGVAPRNIFDTQIAAGFAGFSAQAGYANLLQAALGIRLHKSAGFTRWERRPLTAEQLDYARKDVEDVLALADELKSRLTASGRIEWAREECRRLEAITDERDPDSAYRRLPRINQLRPRARAVARALAAWRERTAQAEDRPVGSVLPDVALVEIARRQPTDLSELGRIRGIRPDTGRRRGRQIIETVARSKDDTPPAADEAARSDADPADTPVIALSEALIRARAQEAGLAYELVASRADLGEIVAAVREGRAEPDVRTLRGWRRDLAGVELLALLRGEVGLSVEAARGVRIRQLPR